MKVYILSKKLEGYDMLGIVNPDEDTKLLLRGFRGQPMQENWHPVKLYTQEQGKKSDYPGHPKPIFSEKAVNTLMDLL
ncbi:hypothetical protein, partial [Caldalkalibacillus salinus]|uniref:hypothetical protein n=1 Tax=Caldalkalibacillus salinus TaxID=2803787 RepID=UPI003B007745